MSLGVALMYVVTDNAADGAGRSASSAAPIGTASQSVARSITAQDLENMRAYGDKVVIVARGGAPSSAVPSITEAAAFRALGSNFQGISSNHLDSVDLIRLTDSRFGKPTGSTGSPGPIARAIDDRLVWLFVFSGVQIPDLGPADTGKLPANAGDANRMWAAVDATTGAPLIARTLNDGT